MMVDGRSSGNFRCNVSAETKWFYRKSQLELLRDIAYAVGHRIEGLKNGIDHIRGDGAELLQVLRD